MAEDILSCIDTINPELGNVVRKRDSGAELLRILSLNVSPADVATPDGDRIWELCGTYLYRQQRFHESLRIFLELYKLELAAQFSLGRRFHK
jgi:hypothetical protein